MASSDDHSTHTPLKIEQLKIAYVVKSFPRLTEGFLAQEIAALEDRGHHISIWALEHPKDITVHPVHRRVRAEVSYLPLHAYKEPLRVYRALHYAFKQTHLKHLWRTWLKDFKRDPTRLRVRALVQGLALAHELEEHQDIQHIHAHHLNMPSSVARYAALLTGRTWSFSAHSKDIWLTPDWEKREKLDDSAWGLASTGIAQTHLKDFAQDPEHVILAYHGLDLNRFPYPPTLSRPRRDGTDPHGAVRLLSVGWACERKGYDDLIRALASLPHDLNWQFAHVGEGKLVDSLKDMAQRGGVINRMVFMGALTQPKIIDLMRAADIFVLPCKETENGDRDSLPNVLLEAASQHLAIISTDFSAIPEFIRNGIDGYLVPPSDWLALSNTLNMLIRDPERRVALGNAAYARLTQKFSSEPCINTLDIAFRTMYNAKKDDF